MVTAMKTSPLSPTIHPEGEASRLPSTPLPVDTYGGRIHVEWDPQAAVIHRSLLRSSPSQGGRLGSGRSNRDQKKTCVIPASSTT